MVDIRAEQLEAVAVVNKAMEKFGKLDILVNNAGLIDEGILPILVTSQRKCKSDNVGNTSIYRKSAGLYNSVITPF